MKHLEEVGRKYGDGRWFVVSFGYWFGAHSLGLVLHPYQSMRRIVRERVFRPLVLLPLVTAVGWWVTGAVVARINVLASLGLSLVSGKLSGIWVTGWVLSFGWVTGVVFLGLWQIMLGYLYWRFRNLSE